MIRRELSLTTCASPAEPAANRLRGVSFALAPADSVLELDGIIQLLVLRGDLLICASVNRQTELDWMQRRM